MNRFLVLALAVPVLAGAGAVGQEPQSPVRESAEVLLVEVPVRVTGRDGLPMRNLTAADFELFDDGKRQSIVGVDSIDLAEKSAAEGLPLNPAARRRFLILFDLSFSRPKALMAARDAAKEFVLSGISDQDLAAVATFSLDTGVRLIINFSSDRVQVARAIDTLGLSTSLAKEKDPLEVVFDTSLLVRRASGSVASGGRAANTSDAALLESLETLKAMGRAADDRYARARIGRLFSSFDDLAAVLDMVGGRKDIIYLSEGFESRLIVGTRDTEQEKEWITSGELWKIDSDKRFGSSAVQNELDHMSALFRRSDCAIHAVDLSGIRTDADVSSLAPARPDNSLFELAQGTGGEVLRNSNDFGVELADVIHRTNLVYVLAFRPAHAGGEGKFH
ncbi:MAG: VWA domain-containing protein, partial [Acidobacteriota bacterium]